MLSIRMLPFAILLLLFPQDLLAAKIQYKSGYIEITGEIEPDDPIKLQKLLVQLLKPLKPIEPGMKPTFFPARKDIVVHLRSQGGDAAASIDIGTMIARNKMQTYAAGDCLSGCGLIWLGGSRKYIHPKARVGFHNIYDPKTRKPQMNAILGVFLGIHGYGYDTATFVTEAPATGMRYLSNKESSQSGISYRVQSFPVGLAALKNIPLPTENISRYAQQVDATRSFIGKLEDGKPTGFGIMEHVGTGTYEGNWKTGKRHGFGTYNYEDGTSYIGGWKNGEKHGFSTTIASNGRKTRQFWINGQISAVDMNTNPHDMWKALLVTHNNFKDLKRDEKRIKSKYENVIGNAKLSYDHERAPTTQASTFYHRLYIATFTEEHAKYLCEQFEDAGQKCEVVE